MTIPIIIQAAFLGPWSRQVTEVKIRPFFTAAELFMDYYCGYQITIVFWVSRKSMNDDSKLFAYTSKIRHADGWNMRLQWKQRQLTSDWEETFLRDCCWLFQTLDGQTLPITYFTYTGMDHFGIKVGANSHHRSQVRNTVQTANVFATFILSKWEWKGKSWIVRTDMQTTTIG